MKNIWKKLCGFALAASLFAPLAGCEKKMPVVTLDKRNGEELERIEMQYRGTATYQSGAKLFPNPTREGWFFDGWFLDEACTQSAYGVPITDDVTFYAGWVDFIKVPRYVPDWLIDDYSELFTITSTAEPYGIYGEVKLTVSVTANADFTGEKSADEINLQISHQWLSDEQFMGEYVSDEVVAYASAWGIVLKKENNYSVSGVEVIADTNNVYHVYASTYNNNHTRTIVRIFDEPILQYNHS